YARTQDPVAPGTAILGAGVSVEHIKAGPARRLAAEECARYMPEVAGYLADRWRTKAPDVVHAFSWTAGLAAIGAVRGTGIPVVQSFESLGSIERRQAGLDVCGARVRLEASIGRTAAAVLASSEEEADELARLAVPKSAIRVIPAGIDTINARPDDVRAKSSDKPRLLAFADDQARGLSTVIRALAQLPAVRLTIIGGPDAKHLPRSGPFREVAQLATELRVRSRVTFAGEVAEAEESALLCSADVMVSATSYDPTGLAAIRAMSCGLPVIASAVGGQRDAVIDGITGFLVAPEHPAMLVLRLRALLARPAMLQAYGIAAADRARSRYCIDRIGQETAAAYERCLPRTAPREDELADTEEAEDLRGVAAFA
ncbi:MAG TPA: glycosyltransferase, partial [Streptosporangiaceae bacterium]|nr:glycosyltransferase [Streptosporangiaceae bacterium]